MYFDFYGCQQQNSIFLFIKHWAFNIRKFELSVSDWKMYYKCLIGNLNLYAESFYFQTFESAIFPVHRIPLTLNPTTGNLKFLRSLSGLEIKRL